MKKIKLTNGEYTLVDKEDYNYLKNFKWLKRSNYVGYVKQKNKKQTTILMHRLIMNAKKGEIIDHINRNPLDNRKKNLRLSNKSKNAANCKIHKHNTSGYKGVSKYRNKFKAYIVKNNKQIHIGCFYTKKEAAIAYNKKALELFGKHANLNEV